MLVGFALEAAKRQSGGGGRAKRNLRSAGEHLRMGASALQGCILIKGFSALHGIFSEREDLVLWDHGPNIYKDTKS